MARGYSDLQSTSVPDSGGPTVTGFATKKRELFQKCQHEFARQNSHRDQLDNYSLSQSENHPVNKQYNTLIQSDNNQIHGSRRGHGVSISHASQRVNRRAKIWSVFARQHDACFCLLLLTEWTVWYNRELHVGGGVNKCIYQSCGDFKGRLTTSVLNLVAVNAAGTSICKFAGCSFIY